MTRKIFFLLLIGTSAFAQQKNFTMKEAVLGMSSTFAVQNLKQLQWMGKSDYYAYAFTNEANKCIVRTHAPTGKLDTFITLEQYNSIGSTKLTALPAMEWVDENSFLYQLTASYPHPYPPCLSGGGSRRTGTSGRCVPPRTYAQPQGLSSNGLGSA